MDNRKLSAELAEALQLAEAAASIMRNGGDVTSAAWRLADAGLMLRRHLTIELPHDDLRSLCGYDEPTGRGAMLPMTARA